MQPSEIISSDGQKLAIIQCDDFGAVASKEAENVTMVTDRLPGAGEN